MKQSLKNLLHNAFNYTPDGTLIRIQARYEDGIFILFLEDYGPGFPEEEIDLVFEKFYRLKSSRPGGTGLGLSIVKGFIEAQGGTISLKNNEQGGARFEIRLPTVATNSIAK